MPVMCANVATGPLVEKVEKHINQGSAIHASGAKASTGNGNVNDEHGELLADLRDQTEPLAGLLVKYKIVPNDDPILDHLNDHWFNDGHKSWWPHNEHKEHVLRHGLAEAIKLRQTKTRPISIIWVCAGHHFQVAIHCSDVQITVLILTPHTPYGTKYEASERPTNLWVVGTERDIDQIVREAGHADGRPTKDDCERLGDGPVWKAQICST